MAKKYLKQWSVPSSTNKDKKYKVSMYWSEVNEAFVFECGCPHWIYRHKECHHIRQIRLYGGKEIKRPEYILVKGGTPRFDKEENKLLIPLVAIGDMHMEAYIDYMMLQYGWSWGEVKDKRNLHNSWTRSGVINYINDHGPCVRKVECNNVKGRKRKAG